MVSWKRAKKRMDYFEKVYERKEFLPESLVRKEGNKNPFSRNRKLNLNRVFWYVLDVGRETTHLTIDRLFGRFKSKGEFAFVSQQALSKARGKMNEKPFRDMFDEMIKGEYQGLIDPEETVPLSRWGYHIFSIDGSEVSLSGTAEIKEKYKVNTNGTYKAVISVMTDVTNNMAIDGLWGEGETAANERPLADAHIRKVPEILGDDRKNVIFLCDRNYMGDARVSLIESYGYKYCFRVRRHHDRKIDSLPVDCDEILPIKSNEMRVVKFILSSGELETLCTNLYDFSVEDLKELYNLRWGSETKYLELKKRLELENFRGYSLNVMKQDFYSTLLADYFLTVAENEAAPEIAKAKAACKYDYDSNRNVLVGVMKKNLIKYFMAPSEAERRRIMKEILANAEKIVVPIRSDRPRDKKARRHIRDFHPNHKSNT